MARQPYTLLWESSVEGVDGQPPLLLAGTANRLFRYTPDGTTVLLHSHEFCDDGDLFGARFGVAQLAGLFAVIHTRGGIWDLTAESTAQATPGFYSYLRPNDSAIALGIQQAQLVHQSHGFFFFSDLIVDGVRERGLTHWTDFESTNLTPGGESQAGFFSFGGEAILRKLDLGNSVVFYTDKAIWLANYVGGEIVWSFERIYQGPDVPRYPWSVVDVGDAHVYLSANTMFFLLRGERSPRVFGWIDKATGIIFSGARPELLDGLPEGLLSLPGKLNPRDCQRVSAWYNDNERHLWIAWQDDSEEVTVPNWCMVLSLQHQTSCLVDHGFTAGVMTKQPIPGTRQTFRQHLWETLGCEPHPIINEHSIDYGEPILAPPLNLYNETEDPDLPPGQNSVYCSDMEQAGRCLTVCPQCIGANRLIMACAEDFSIKEWSWEYGLREQISNVDELETILPWNNVPIEDEPWAAVGPNPVVEAEYRHDNFVTLFQSDAIIRGKESASWTLSSFELGLSAFHANADEVADLYPFPWNFFANGAGGDSARCVIWNETDQDEFGCPPEEEAAMPSYVLGSANPLLHVEAEGRYVAFRFWTGDAPGGTNRCGPVAFTGMTPESAPASCR